MKRNQNRKKGLKLDLQEKLMLLMGKFHVKKAFVALFAGLLLWGGSAAQARETEFTRLMQIAFDGKGEAITPYITGLDGTATDNGLALNLLAAYRDGDELAVFYTLTDLTGDRLSGEIDVFSELYTEAEEINGGIQYGGGGRIDYDPDTKTAAFMHTGNIGSLADNDNVVFNIGRIEMGRKDIAVVAPDIDAYSILAGHKANIRPEKELIFDADGTVLENIDFATGIRLLTAGEVDIPFEALDWLSVTNMGFVDGNLHIQVKLQPDTENKIYRVYFVNAAGETVFGDDETDKILNVSYELPEENNGGSFKEYIFYSVSQAAQIKDLYLKVEAVEYMDVMNTTDFSVSFAAPRQMPSVNIPVTEEFRMFGETVNNGNLVLSPLGLKIYYVTDSLKMLSAGPADVYITYTDGTKEVLTPGMSEKSLINADYGLIYSAVMRFEGPVIEMDRVQSIYIDGNTFTVAG